MPQVETLGIQALRGAEHEAPADTDLRGVFILRDPAPPSGEAGAHPTVSGSQSSTSDLTMLRGVCDDFSWKSAFRSKPSAELTDWRGTVCGDPCFHAS